VLVEQNSLLKSFVWIVFYTSAVRIAFSFRKLPNIHFCYHFLQICHNLRTINGHVIISVKEATKLDTPAILFQTIRNRHVSWQDYRAIKELTEIRIPRRHKNWADELQKLAPANIALQLVLAPKSELSLND